MHPHTSAGRIPTPKGYRIYVRSLMHVENLTQTIKKKIRQNVETVNKNIDFLLSKTSETLSLVSHQLGVVIGPSLEKAIVERIQIFIVADRKIMIVISLSGIIKSVVVEISAEMSDKDIDSTCAVLNERLCGLSVETVRDTISSRLKDSSGTHAEITRLFLDSAEEFFNFDEKKIFIGGTKHIAEQPEFGEHEKLKSIIELVEKKDVIVHLLSRTEDDSGLLIKIGEPDDQDIAKSFSIVSRKFKLGNQTGTLGVIGPVRMWYPKMVPLVDYTAEVINKIIK